MKNHSIRSLISLVVSVFLLASLPIHRSRAQTDVTQDPKIFRSGSESELRMAHDLTRQYFANNRQAFGLDRKNDSKLLRSWVDEAAMAHVRVQQTFDKVPVFGGELIIHWTPSGTLSNVTNAWINDLKVDATPSLSEDTAIETATSKLKCDECLESKPITKLWIQRHEGTDHLVYEVRLPQIETHNGPSMPIYFVDAHSGEIVWSYDNLQTATGQSLYNGQVTFSTFHGAESYFLEDVSRKIGTYSYNNGTANIFDITDNDDFWTDATAVDAHYGMSAVIDYFKNVHQRDGLNGVGGPYFKTSQDGITPLFGGKIHYSIDYVNAFWNGNSVVFGDGDGSLSSPLVTADIIGHEMTHALTESTASLLFNGEPGSLNESMSDIFGAMLSVASKVKAMAHGPSVKSVTHLAHSVMPSALWTTHTKPVA